MMGSDGVRLDILIFKPAPAINCVKQGV